MLTRKQIFALGLLAILVVASIEAAKREKVKSKAKPKTYRRGEGWGSDYDDELDAEWEDWEDPELRYKRDQEKHKGYSMDKITEMLNRGEVPTSGPKMMFVKIKKELGIRRTRFDELMSQWKSMILTNGVESFGSPIDDVTAVLNVNEGSKGHLVKNFLVEQPEVEEVVMDSQTYKGVAK
eukprot:TRINITY_DN1383_c0_g1_i1.p1 TRINITY_DN1383_c0_g1~~TRINITY_DN1383_c0_g1_i1.p1  ORF type:complete len:180 (+),score=51.62 TRINITY_DN1383_c0_g1_i1:47-586(+)